MTNEDIIAAIAKQQSDTRFHPLTCGNDSRHKVLVGVVVDDKVVLKCEDCDYIQKYIPNTI